MRFSMAFIFFFAFVGSAHAADITEIRLQSLRKIRFNSHQWAQMPTQEWGINNLVFVSKQEPGKTLVISQKIMTTSLSEYCKEAKGVISANFCLTPLSKNAYMAVQIIPIQKKQTRTRTPAFFTSYYIRGDWSAKEVQNRLDRLANHGVWE